MYENSTIAKALFGGLLALAVTSCGGGGSSGSDDSSSNNDDPDAHLVDAQGNETSEVGADDPVTVNLDNLEPNSHYRVRVTGPNGEQLHPSGGYVMVSDEDGSVGAHTIVQNLGTTQTSVARASASGEGESITRTAAGEAATIGVGSTGSYSIEVVDGNGDMVTEQSFSVADNSRVYCADSTGTARASFTSSESVYAQVEQGSGSLSDGDYDVHLVSDLNPVLDDGDALPSAAGTVSVSGGSGSLDLGTFSEGVWDVVVDVDDDGQFTAGTDLISRSRRFHPCFTIQQASGNSSIIGQVASDSNGNYRDVFDPNAADRSIRDVYAYITPSQRSLVQETLGVDKYVVQHQDTWSDGDTLTDVTAGLEVDPVQAFCTNEAPWRVWPRELLEPGCYDVVVDVNSNGQYDVGTDFVDNINTAGETTCGFRVADPECTNNISVTSHSDGAEVDATAITLEGSVSASSSAGQFPETGQVTITSGEESTTVGLSIDGDGNFSADVPLFAGDNELSLSFTYPNGTACASTLTVTNTSASSSDVKFRAQLLWDGDTDMDLHLVRPGGEYMALADDCHWRNCKVGLDGSGSNSIDWGVSGEAEDPKLDVDCIACGDGVENIWLNEIPQNGDYTVYVDAFNGVETNVRVAIYIGGSQVSTVNCGDMDDDTSTDSCRVGTISWSGGDDGTGTFSADGSKGSQSTFTSVTTSTAGHTQKKAR